MYTLKIIQSEENQLTTYQGDDLEVLAKSLNAALDTVMIMGQFWKDACIEIDGREIIGLYHTEVDAELLADWLGLEKTDEREHEAARDYIEGVKNCD